MSWYYILTDIVLPFGHWVARVVDKFLPWPAIVLFMLLYAPTRGALTAFLRGLGNLPTAVRTVKVAGIEIGTDPNNARQVADSSAEIVIAAFRASADEACREAHLRQKLEQLIDAVIVPQLKKLYNNTVPTFRSTIHIPDSVYVETFYQLVEYVHRPASPGGPQAETRGRRLSLRFGIIGRAWRLGRSDYDPAVSTIPAELIEKWGMTASEAGIAGRGHKSFTVFLIRDAEHIPLAALFIDSGTEGLFGDKTAFDQLDPLVLAAAEKHGLVKALAQVTSILAANFPQPIRK